MKSLIVVLAALLTSITVTMCVAGCHPPPPTAVADTAAEVRCVAGQLMQGIKDPLVIASACALPSIDVAIDIVASLDTYADKRAACPGTAPASK